MNALKLSILALVASAAFAGAAVARDQIQISGSSTVFPYAKIVAENFGETHTNFSAGIELSDESSSKSGYTVSNNAGSSCQGVRQP